MTAINYNKWDNIEVSDDEDDTHPNIDTPSLFRWRHQARVERMQEFETKKKIAEEDKKKIESKKKVLENQIKTTKEESDLTSIKKALAEVEKENVKVKEKMDDLAKEERLQPWNVDTISSEGFSKTLINKNDKSQSAQELSEEEREVKMREFIKEHKKEIEEYGMFSKFEDSKNFLSERKYLCCEETANYLVIQCINYAMEEKFGLMEHVSHQVIAMQYLLELAKQLNIDPRACISSFFSKIQKADEQYKKAFYDELEAFKERIRKRAKEKVEEQLKEMEESQELEEVEAPLGPGGLNPVEVFNSLPESLQKCFESKDIALLQEMIKELPEQDARYHMKRCIDSGLWVPAKEDPNTDPEDGFRKGNQGDVSSEGEYEEVGKREEKK